MTKRDFVKDYISKHGKEQQSTRSLSNELCENHPEMFTSYEQARSVVRSAGRKGIESACERSDINNDNVKHGWVKDKGHSLFFVNPDFKPVEFDIDSIDWDEILQPLGITQKPPVKECDTYAGKFDRVVYSDVHVGMTPNKDGYSLYGGKWDEKELNKCLELMINHILANQNSNTLYLDDLGDFMDGWDGHTVRRQHPLPQNMDNQRAFDVGLGFKIKLLDKLTNHYNKIVCHNICNDNHSGAFGYVVNSALKQISELKFSNVEVINQRKFIGHYSVGKNTFIITHGKDGENLKFGFKPKIDAVGIEKIDNYIKEFYLFGKNTQIEFSKGDSHQMLFDYSSSDSFNYFNYPAFSPSSNWVQSNYKRGKSGFVMFNYLNNQVNVLPYFFNWVR